MSRNSPIKDVLAIVDGDPASFAGVDQAIAYATLHEASLTIVVATENVSFAAAVEPYGYAIALKATEELNTAHLDGVRARVKGAAIPVEVHGLLETPDLLPRAAKGEGRYADIVLIPAPERWRDHALRRHIAESILFAGVPVLLAPADWTPTLINHAVLGWNASLEAFRAGRAVLALAEPKAHVDVVVIDGIAGDKTSQTVPGTHIARHLGRHRHQVEVHAINSAKQGTAGALQAFAASRDADLLIVGGYGHSRAMEFVLGGVTRELLARPRVPIVLVH
ncbi:universal stress protein [Sphingobium xenophagum]|uniref:universal stress protein n=1 Tax=Sphingobium xenophagum TaxID=121428 RepID=UPI001C0C5ACE|nr:universal stress protein [Sphingobium xenophagum]QWT16590.1 universal stress protein [Sphingobium xenophagum]